MNDNFWLLENAGIELIDGDRGKNYPSLEHFSESGYCLFLSAKNVTKAGFNFTEQVFIDRNRDNLLRAGKLNKGDIVLTTRGTIGNVALYDDFVPFDNIRINSGMIIMRADESLWCRKFLYLLFTSESIKKQILSLTSGSAVPQLPAKDLKKFVLPKLPIPVQQKIADIIDALVQKVKLHHQINQTLAAIAQAIFKSWFVDFEPVKAKMAVLQAGGSQDEAEFAAMMAISGKTAEQLSTMRTTRAEAYQQLTQTTALFPAAMQDSELGEIPEGWQYGKLGNLFNQQRDKIGNLSANVLSAVTEGELVLSDEYFSKQVYSKTIEKYLKVEPWDFAYNPSRINIGSIGMLKNDVLGAVSPVYVVAKPRFEFRWFLEYFIKSSIFRGWVEKLSSGSVRQSLAFNDFATIPLVIPSESMVLAFNCHIEKRWHMSKHIDQINKSLSDIKDSLLPKLLSGEIDLTTLQEVAND